MSSISRLRQTHMRRFSTIFSSNSTKPLSTKENSRAVLSRLKSEDNPDEILRICRAASLTPEFHLDRIAFSVAISKLAESNHLEGIRQFLEELKNRPDLQNERFASHAMVLYGQAGMIDHSIRTFKEMGELGIPRSVKSLNALLVACIMAKDYREVNQIFLEFPKRFDIEPDIDTYNTVVKAFCESNSSNSVYSVLNEMERKRVKPNETMFGTWLAGFYKEEKFKDVGDVLKLMEKHGVRPGLGTYNIRIQSLCKLKKSAEAKGLLDGMLSSRLKPNSVTYCHLIHGFCKEGKLDEAKNLFDKMIERGCKPDSNCYFTLISFLCQNKDFEAALELCKESIMKGWVPNFSTMKTLVEGLVSISKVASAKVLIKQIKGRMSRNLDMWNEIEAGLPSEEGC